MFRSKLKTPERESAVKTEQIEWVFGLTGGELSNELWGGYAYNYEGVPEWATEDFDRDTRYCVSGEYRTVIVVGGGFLPSPKESIVVDDEVWELVQTYTNSGETECPQKQADESHNRKVTRKQCWLVPCYRKNRASHYMNLSDITAKRAECPYCEARIGEEHGYIYVGESYEAVYKRAPFEGPLDENGDY